MNAVAGLGIRKYAWTTEKGAQIELELTAVEIEKTVWADEPIATTEKATAIMLKINGKAIEMPVLGEDRVRFYLNGIAAAAMLPEDVRKAIWDGYHAEQHAKLQRQIAADRKYEAHKRAIYRMMDAKEDK